MNSGTTRMFTAPLWSHQSKRTPKFPNRRSGPPINPNQAMRRGTQRIFEARWGVQYSSADTFRLVILGDKNGQRLDYGISPLNSERAP